MAAWKFSFQEKPNPPRCPETAYSYREPRAAAISKWLNLFKPPAPHFSWHSFRYDRWRLILEWGQMTLIIRFLLEGFHDAAAFFNGSVLPAWSSCSSPRGKHMQKSLAAYCRQIHREACLHNAAYAVIRKRKTYIIACAGNTAKPAAEAWKALLHKTTRRQPDSGQ